MASQRKHIEAARQATTDAAGRLAGDRDQFRVSDKDLAEALKALRVAANQVVQAQMARKLED